MINFDELDFLLDSGKYDLNMFNSNSIKLMDSIKELNDCYSGNSLSFLFSNPINELKNIGYITEILENYFDVLYKIKHKNEKQEEKLIEQIEHITSNLQ